jgi:hypothetical protein
MIAAFLELLTSVMKFIAENWKKIAVVFIVAAYTYSVYLYGYNRSDAQWVKYTNDVTKSHNATIYQLEKDSREASDRVQQQVQDLNTRISELMKKPVPNSYVDSGGKTVSCNGKELTLFHNLEFVNKWNALNTEANK